MLNFHALNDEELEIAHDLMSIKPMKITPVVKNYLKKHKVYISMTSGPLRLRKIPAVLSLLDLSDVSEIHINLPKYYRNKLQGGLYKKDDIDFVSSVDSRIKIFRPSEDIGPMTKIIPTLQRIKDSKAIIISIDDDIGYPYNLISLLIYNSVVKQREMFTGAGFVFGDYPGSDFDRKLWPQKKSSKYVDIVEGWGGIAYKKSLITNQMIKEILELNKVSTTCKLSDDFTISYVLAAHGVKCREIKGIREKLEPFKYGEDADALHKGSGVKKTGAEDENMTKYHVCLTDIDKSGSRSRIKHKRQRSKKLF